LQEEFAERFRVRFSKACNFYPVDSSDIGISFATQTLARCVYAPGIVCRPLVHEQLILDTHTAIRRGHDSKLVNAFVLAYHRKYKEEAEKLPSLFPA